MQNVKICKNYWQIIEYDFKYKFTYHFISEYALKDR